MAKLPQNENKLFIKVTPDFDQHFTDWAKKFGLTKSQFGNLCVQAGLNAVIRAVNPELSFSPEQLAAIAKLANDDRLEEKLKKRGGEKSA